MKNQTLMDLMYFIIMKEYQQLFLLLMLFFNNMIKIFSLMNLNLLLNLNLIQSFLMEVIINLNMVKHIKLQHLKLKRILT